MAADHFARGCSLTLRPGRFELRLKHREQTFMHEGTFTGPTDAGHDYEAVQRELNGYVLQVVNGGVAEN
jgi:hypothetical protein